MKICAGGSADALRYTNILATAEGLETMGATPMNRATLLPTLLLSALTSLHAADTPAFDIKLDAICRWL
jgi:hypothetical protein